MLRADSFAGLSSLLTLTLDSNPLVLIEPGAFRGLSALTDLEMSYLPITSVPSRMLADTPLLTKFTASVLPAAELPDLSLCPQLETVAIFGGAFRTLRRAHFQNLTKLKTLILFNGQVVRVEKDVFSDLLSLSLFSLEGNPSVCSLIVGGNGLNVTCNCGPGTTRNGTNQCVPVNCGQLSLNISGVQTTCGPDTSFAGDNCVASCLGGYIGSNATYQCSAAGQWVGNVSCSRRQACFFSVAPSSAITTNGTHVAFPSPTVSYATPDDAQNITYTLEPGPGCLAADPATGIVSGVACEVGTHTLRLQASGTVKPLECYGQLQLRVTVLPPVLVTVTNPPDTTATELAYYEAGLQLNVSGGSGMYTYSAHGLPPGVTIYPTTGIISGQPTASGDFHVRVIVADSYLAETAAPDFTISVARSLARSGDVVYATHGTNFCVPVPPVIGGQPFSSDHTYDLELDFNRTSLGLTLLAPGGTTATTVAASTMTSSSSSGSSGATVSALQAVAADGAAVVAEASHEEGASTAAPSSSSTPLGTICGTGLPGTHSVVITVIDSNNAYLRSSFVLEMSEAIVLHSDDLPLAPIVHRVSTSRSYNTVWGHIIVSGGRSPLTAQLIGAPSGLEVCENFTICGEPIEPGVFNVSARVIDDNGARLEFVVAPSLTIEPAPASSSASSKLDKNVVIAVSVAGSVVVLVAVAVIYTLSTRKVQTHNFAAQLQKITNVVTVKYENMQPPDELDPHSLQVLDQLGEGNFGQVRRGMLTLNVGITLPVAVKVGQNVDSELGDLQCLCADAVLVVVFMHITQNF